MKFYLLDTKQHTSTLIPMQKIAAAQRLHTPSALFICAPTPDPLNPVNLLNLLNLCPQITTTSIAVNLENLSLRVPIHNLLHSITNVRLFFIRGGGVYRM